MRIPLRNKLFLPILFLLYVCIILITIPVIFFSPEKNILYAEFIQSHDFGQLLYDNLTSFSPRVHGGTYNIGFPISPQNENVYGTNRGARTIPLLLFLALLQKIFGNWWDRAYFFIILIAPFFVFIITSRYIWRFPISLELCAASFIYSFNPWILHRLKTGFLQLHLSYSVMPLFLSCLVAPLRPQKSAAVIFRAFLLALSASVIFHFQPHFFVIVIAVLAPLGIFNLRWCKENLPPLTPVWILGSLMFFLWNVFVIIPPILFTPFKFTRDDIFSLGSLFFNGQGSTVLDVLSLTSRSPLETTIITATSRMYYLVVFAGFIFFGITAMVSKRTRAVAIPLCLSLGCLVFLAKGLNEPFSHLSRYIYLHTPILHAFRDPSRFISGVVLVGCVLIFISSPKHYHKFLLTVYLFVNIALSLFIFTRLPMHDWSQEIPFASYSEHIPLPDNQRIYFIRERTDLSDSCWYNAASGSTNRNPLEAITPSRSDLASHSGSNDSLFSHAYQFMDSLHKQDNPNADFLLQRLRVGQLWSETCIGNDPVQIAVKRTPPSKFPVQQVRTDTPVFLLGERYDYATLAAMLPPEVPILMLDQPVNADSFFLDTWDASPPAIITAQENEVELRVALASLSLYSLRLDEVVRHHDKEWTYFLPYAEQEIARGYLFTSGRSIISSKPRATLTVFPAVSGKHVLAIKWLASNLNGGYTVHTNGSPVTPALTQQNTNGFSWDTYFIDMQSDDQIMLQASGSDNPTLIEEVLLIPSATFARRLATVNEKLKDFSIVHLRDGTIPNHIPSKSQVLLISPHRLVINTTSSWITLPFPFEYGWSADRPSRAYIAEGYSQTMRIANQNRPSRVNIFYKPESFFQASLLFSGTSFLVCLAMVLGFFPRKNGTK